MQTVDTTVTVSIGDKEFSKVYKKVVYETTDDIMTLLADEKTAKQAIKDINYGSDLKAKAEVRNAILSEQAGPEKSLEKQVKEFMKAREAVGKPITEEKARAMVKALLESE